MSAELPPILLDEVRICRKLSASSTLRQKGRTMTTTPLLEVLRKITQEADDI